MNDTDFATARSLITDLAACFGLLPYAPTPPHAISFANPEPQDLETLLPAINHLAEEAWLCGLDTRLRFHVQHGDGKGRLSILITEIKPTHHYLDMKPYTFTNCPLCAGTGKENDGDSWQNTPCACVEERMQDV